jgi:hypothetical protein
MILTSNYILDFVFHTVFLYLFGMYIQSVLRTPGMLLFVSLGLAAFITFVNHVYFSKWFLPGSLPGSLPGTLESHNPYCPRCPCNINTRV